MAQAAPQPVPSATRAERTRRRILQAAASCFAAKGFSRTTVEEIDATAGVSKGLVYHHFRAKELILEALLERTLSDWTRVSGVREHVARTGSVLAGLEHALRGSLEYARSNPLLRGLLLAALMVLGLSTGLRDLLRLAMGV